MIYYLVIIHDLFVGWNLKNLFAIKANLVIQFQIFIINLFFAVIYLDFYLINIHNEFVGWNIWCDFDFLLSLILCNSLNLLIFIIIF